MRHFVRTWESNFGDSATPQAMIEALQKVKPLKPQDIIERISNNCLWLLDHARERNINCVDQLRECVLVICKKSPLYQWQNSCHSFSMTRNIELQIYGSLSKLLSPKGRSLSSSSSTLKPYISMVGLLKSVIVIPIARRERGGADGQLFLLAYIGHDLILLLLWTRQR